MKRRHHFVGAVPALLCMFLFFSCASQSPTPAPQPKAPTTEKAYVTFEGPWAIVADPKDPNFVIAVAPRTTGHRDLYVGASNEAVLQPGVYELSLPPKTGSAAATFDPSIVRAKIDPAQVQHVLEDKSRRYAIRLPKPEECRPQGSELSRVANTYPPPASTEASHANGFALLYNVTSMSGFSVAGVADTGPSFKPFLLKVETPVVRFVIPSAEYDDSCYTHSRQAFRDLVRLVGVKLYVDFPDNPGDCRKKDPQLANAEGLMQFRTESVSYFRPRARARTEYWLSADASESISLQMHAVFYALFGKPSGICHAPVLGGDP
jgi:hypothetical protein